MKKRTCLKIAEQTIAPFTTVKISFCWYVCVIIIVDLPQICTVRTCTRNVSYITLAAEKCNNVMNVPNSNFILWNTFCFILGGRHHKNSNWNCESYESMNQRIPLTKQWIEDSNKVDDKNNNKNKTDLNKTKNLVNPYPYVQSLGFVF